MSALAKLEQVLPARLRSAIGRGLVAAEAIRGRGVPPVDPGALAVLARCCRNHEIVAFDYYNRQGVRTRRRVEPYQLLTVSWYWYLLAFDPSRDDWRTFRVDRIDDLGPALHRFVPRPLPAADAASYLIDSFATAPYKHSVRLTIQLPADVVASYFHGLVSGTIEPTGAGACVAHFTAETPSLVLQYVAGVVALGA